MQAAASIQLLDAFPLVRSRSAEDASERIGRIFSPHRLEVRGRSQALDVQLNRVGLRDVSLNVLYYGAEVLIDPGVRGDFYLVQLPLAGSAELACGRELVCVDPQVLSVLQPRVRSRMRWSGDCQMILVQVPRSVVQRRAAQWGVGPNPHFALARSRQDPDVAAWWQAVLDLTCNLHRYGHQWLRHPAAHTAMEEFLLAAFTTMLCEPDCERGAERADARSLRRAKDYIHAHPERALTLAEIAEHACVCPRTLELVFKRHGEVSPLAYARRHRLRAVHEALRGAQRDGRALSITDLALAHGFLHLGRFAAQYREQFGCSPSETLHPH
jgi:AraC-like DNA-binding protein